MIETDKIAKLLDIHGVCVVPSVYSREQINNLKSIAIDTELKINDLLPYNKPNIYNYYTHFDIEKCYRKNYYNLETMSIIELVKGRYDITYKNFKNNINPIIESIINKKIKKNYSKSFGLLTSSPESNNGHWHRDVVNICGDSDDNGVYDDSKMVKNFEPFYYTVLIPLVELTKENGTPEFIEGSHKLTYQESKNQKHLRFNTTLGDAIIFDGRIFHRGCSNNTNIPRPILYNVIHRNWYIENGL